MPLPPGEIPRKQDLRYLKGFGLFEPGFGPTGPPDWSESESDATPLFEDGQIGELSFAFHSDLGRWLLVYNGCATGQCGILLRSAPRAWGPWTGPQLIFESVRDGAQGKYMFECGPYGPYMIARYNRFDPVSGKATIYYTLSNGSCRVDNDASEPRYQVHLMRSDLRLVLA
jgi:hypothetical protein